MAKLRTNIYSHILQWFVLLTVFISCTDNTVDSPVEEVKPFRGQIVSVTPMTVYDISLVKLMLATNPSTSNIKIEPKYNVAVHKVVYRTIDWKGNIVIASGALFVPQGKSIMSLISVQHGTLTKRSSVASASAINGIEGLIAASLGYFSLEPDYLGLGDSDLLHPYHHAKSSAEPVIDFIRAGKEYAKQNNIQLNGHVFLAGYSEGGFVTLATHREIEENYKNEITVAASCPMAGAYNLLLTAQNIIKRSTYNQPAYLSFFVVAYNNIYGWNKLSAIFNEPYASQIPTLFNGTKTVDEINSSLTNDLAKLFRADFLTSFREGKETDLTNAFINNSLLNFTPKAPIRFYHGNADEYVPYENSVNARDYFISKGATVELITIEGGTHVGAAIPSIVGAIQWFETLRLNKLASNF